jgi:hypothetical protein
MASRARGRLTLIRLVGSCVLVAAGIIVAIALVGLLFCRWPVADGGARVAGLESTHYAKRGSAIWAERWTVVHLNAKYARSSPGRHDPAPAPAETIRVPSQLSLPEHGHFVDALFVGIPFRWIKVERSQTIDGQFVDRGVGILWGGSPAGAVRITALVLGGVANIACVASGAVGLSLLTRFLMRQSRVRARRCPSCSYPLIEQRPRIESVCPECGRPIV